MPRNKTEKVTPFPHFDSLWYQPYFDIGQWLGHTITRIEGAEENSEEVIFEIDGASFKMYHQQDCCEHVSLIDIVGDVDDLIGSPLTMAEEVVSEDDDLVNELRADGDYSHTWTFYKFATLNGYVTLRWYGSSNGYYSESVCVLRTG